jgi:hypothetical protein
MIDCFCLRHFMFYRLLMVACLLAPFSADALDAPADLVPAGLNVGDQFYVVFTTSTYPQATSTLISFYNSYVQGVAAASTISGVRAISSEFQVIGATAATNQCKPADLTKPVYNVNKTQVSSLASLMYADPQAQPLGISLKISESGQDISGPQGQGQAFTGCSPDGSSYIPYILGNTTPTVGLVPLVGIGLTTATDNDWIGGAQQVGNTSSKSLYAISALLTVAPTPQTITASASPTSISVNGTSALSSSGTSGTGAVTYAVVSGPCTVSGSTLTGTGAGTCFVTATIAADSTYASATSSPISVTVIAPAPIPTLSEWSQIMMMLAMIATAGFYGWTMKQR